MDLLGWLLLGWFIVSGLGLLAVLAVAAGPKVWQELQARKQEYFPEEDFDTVDQLEGVSKVLPQYIWEKVVKIVEEKAGVKYPTVKTPEEILAAMPQAERAKLMESVVPMVMDYLRETTGMDLDASLRQREHLLGQELGLTELQTTIEEGAVRLDQGLGAVAKYERILEDHRENISGNMNPAAEFMVKMTVFKVMKEMFKDMELPPGWSAHEVADLLALKPPRAENESPLIGEIVD